MPTACCGRTTRSPAGKLAWFWKARNQAILEQFHRLPASQCRIVRLEDLDFARYQETAEFLSGRTRVDATTFAELAGSRLNAGPNPPRRFGDWSAAEGAEFEAEVAPVAEALSYEYRVNRLAAGSASPVSLGTLPAVLGRLFG